MATSTHGMIGTGWPSNFEPNLRNESSSSSDDRPRRLEHRVVQRRRVALGEDQVVVVGVVRVLRSRAAGASPSGPPSGRPPTSRTSGGRSWRPRRSGPSRRAAAGRARSCGHQPVALALDVGEEVLEGLGELLDALLLERRDDVVVVDAGGLRGPRSTLRAPSTSSSIVLRGSRRGPAIASIVSRGIVLTVSGPIELLDVEDVAVVGVLGRGRRPQAALRGRALGGQRLPVGRRRRSPCRSGRRAWRWRSPACP